MNTQIITLVILSAIIHASWNLLSKKNTPDTKFFLWANTIGALILIPLFRDFTIFQSWPLNTWKFLAYSICFMTVYYNSLAKAYSLGSLSIAYPIARALPIAIIAITESFIRPETLHPIVTPISILLILLGSLLLPQTHFKNLNWKNFGTPSTLFAIFAAIGTAGYSLMDKQAMSGIFTETKFTPLQQASAYCFIQAIGSSISIFFFLLVRKQPIKINLKGFKSTSLAGIGIFSSYVLILYAYQLSPNATYVVGLRQLSIPLGTFLGIIILKEPHSYPKLTGLACILLGIYTLT